MASTQNVVSKLLTKGNREGRKRFCGQKKVEKSRANMRTCEYARKEGADSPSC